YRIGGQLELVAVSGGYAEVLPTKVTILATTAEPAKDIDLERARAARERAEQRLKERQEEIDFLRVEAALQRAIARIRAAERAKL
ncbi:MAG: F0F1 ATP synthase subunit epsilon, partial [Deltaproteobacteria bacterium]|nr:F0F1 ATP synthase subunit epsilon [Deltaproteobacteria bacterium]